MKLNDVITEAEKTRLDPACWDNKKIGNPKTKVKGGVRVNNCVPAESVAEGMLDNPGSEDNPVAQAIIRRILLQRTDLLAKHGPEKVGAAVDEVADFVGDVDEIGSSDVSGWIRHVEQMLGNMDQGVAEGQSPISAGRRAGKAGKPLAPPHPKGSKEYSEFEKGWNEKETVRKANKLAPYNKQGVAEGYDADERRYIAMHAYKMADAMLKARDE